MQIQARPLITALFAVASYLPAVMAQQPNTVNVRPGTAAAQPGLPALQITVDKSRVPVNKTVVFTLEPASVVTSPLFNVTIDFGDGSRSIVSKTEIPHQYGAPGFYTAKVSVKSSGRPDPTASPTSTPNPKIPGVSLSATPTTVAAERPVTFSARLAYRYPGIKYRFVFGDGFQTEWQDQTETTHAYVSANRYQAYVDIGIPSNRSAKQVGGSNRLPIQVTPPRIGQVDLIADPTEVVAGGVVTFTASVASKEPNLTYRFFFGDGSQPGGWQASQQTTHKYLLAGRFPAYVEVGRSGQGPSLAKSVVRQVSVRSAVVTPTPTPTPFRPTPTPSPGVTPTVSPGVSPGGTSSPDAGGTTNSRAGGSPRTNGPLGITNNWWWWLLLLALALIAAYQAVKMYLASQLTFRPVVDPGVTHLEHGAEPLGINFEMVLSPNVSEGQYELETNETSFVRSERSSNG